MSFIDPPVGLDRDDVNFGFVTVTHDHGDWVGGVEYECGVGEGFVTCMAPTVVTRSFAADVTAATLQFTGLPYVLDAPFYLVSVEMNGPGDYDGGTDGCSTDPVFPGCGPALDWTEEVTVDGTYVSDAGTPVSSSGLSVNVGFTLRPPTDPEAWLVNPAPTWPVPDALGNEFGKVLFTPGQLPAAIGAAITVTNAGPSVLPDSGDARITVSLIPFRYVPGGRSSSALMCLL